MKPIAGRAAVLVVICAAIGGLRLHALTRSPLRQLVGHAYRGNATLLRSPRATRFGGWTATARVAGDVVFMRASPSVAESMPAGSLVTGDIVEGLFALLPPDEFAAAVRANAIARVVQARPTGRTRGGASGVVDELRRAAQRGLAFGLPPPQAALLRGMVLGDDAALTPAARNDFRRSGLSHLMAASGQNVVLLVALAVVVATACGIPFTARWIAIACLIALYVALAGGGPSIQRAGVMGILGIFALMTARPVVAGYSLAVAAALTLAWDPRSATDPGWQMSFAAVGGLLVFGRPWAQRLRRAGLAEALAEALAVTAAATLATAPIIAAHFGTASPVALPANLLAAPVVAPIMWLGLAAATLGPVVPVAGAVCDALAGPLLGYLTWVAHAAATAPGAGMSAGWPPVAGVCAATFALVGRTRRYLRRP